MLSLWYGPKCSDQVASSVLVNMNQQSCYHKPIAALFFSQNVMIVLEFSLLCIEFELLIQKADI